MTPTRLHRSPLAIWWLAQCAPLLTAEEQTAAREAVWALHEASSTPPAAIWAEMLCHRVKAGQSLPTALAALWAQAHGRRR